MSQGYDIVLHIGGPVSVAEVRGDGVLIATAGDLLTLIFDARRQKADRIALHAANIDPAFFDLRSGLAGDMLQKLVNYKQQLAIVGDISPYTERSEALKALVRESNRGKDVHFVARIEDATGGW